MEQWKIHFRSRKTKLVKIFDFEAEKFIFVRTKSDVYQIRKIDRTMEIFRAILGMSTLQATIRDAPRNSQRFVYLSSVCVRSISSYPI